MSNANNNHKPGDGSTGPLSEAGKHRSSCNSTAHGARSERHIILDGESAGHFETLRESWLEEFPPIGKEETDMVERIAQTQWRLIRCERLLNEAEAEAFAIDPKPRNWPDEERKYVELMMRYRTAADRAFRAARRDVEIFRRNRMDMMLLEEKTKQAMLASRLAGIEEPSEDTTPPAEEKESNNVKTEPAKTPADQTAEGTAQPVGRGNKRGLQGVVPGSRPDGRGR